MNAHNNWLVEYEDPEAKDYTRARKSILEDQTVSRIRGMANAIRSSDKLVRRAKAMCKVWYEEGDNTSLTGEQFLSGIWQPFEDRLSVMGFSDEQIRTIKRYGFSRGKRLDLI